MITCFIKYAIDPNKVEAFEEYGKQWINLVKRYGGKHLGYFLPHEGANNIAYALFNFKSFADYKTYRKESLEDADCIKTYEFAQKTKCIVSYERSFMCTSHYLT